MASCSAGVVEQPVRAPVNESPTRLASASGRARVRSNDTHPDLTWVKRAFSPKNGRSKKRCNTAAEDQRQGERRRHA